MYSYIKCEVRSIDLTQFNSVHAAYHIATNVLGIFLVILAANTVAMNALLHVSIVESASVFPIVRILDTVKDAKMGWWLVMTA